MILGSASSPILRLRYTMESHPSIEGVWAGPALICSSTRAKTYWTSFSGHRWLSSKLRKGAQGGALDNQGLAPRKDRQRPPRRNLKNQLLAQQQQVLLERIGVDQEPTWASSAESRSPSTCLLLGCVFNKISRGEELGVRRAAARTQDQKAQAQ